MACMCTVTLSMKVKMFGGCASEEDVCRPEAAAPANVRARVKSGDAAPGRGEFGDGHTFLLDEGGEDVCDVTPGASGGLEAAMSPPKSRMQSVEMSSMAGESSPEVKPTASRVTGLVKAIYFACFLYMGVAIALPWASVQFRVTLWVASYDATVWPLMIALYNGPGFFILFIQKWTDAAVERALGLTAAYALRLIVPLSGLSLVLFFFPAAESEKSLLLLFTTGIGIFNGCLYGWLFNFAGLIHPVMCSAILGGAGAAAFVVIGLGAANHIGTPVKTPLDELTAYFDEALTVTAVGIVILLVVLLSPPVRAVLTDPANLPRKKSQKAETSDDAKVLALRKKIQPLLICAGVSHFFLVMFAATVSFVPSATGNKNLPFVVLISTAIAYLAGSETYVFYKFAKTRARLMGMLATIFVVFLLNVGYVFSHVWLNDMFTVIWAVSMTYVVAMANASVYGLVLAETPIPLRPRALNLTTIAVYSGTIVAVTAATIMSQTIKAPPG